MTPEQIESFNARAAAGERPVHPGWAKVSGFPSLCHLVVLDRVGATISARGEQWIILGWARNATEDAPFDSLPAAQLAAEHLLREASAPLYREEIQALAEKRQVKEALAKAKLLPPNQLLDAFIRLDVGNAAKIAALEAQLAAFGEAWDKNRENVEMIRDMWTVHEECPELPKPDHADAVVDTLDDVLLNFDDLDPRRAAEKAETDHE